MTTKTVTPWQRVFEKFGMSQSELATALGRHRSKLSRELASPKGLISSQDQVALLALAKKHGVKLDPADLLPG